MAPLKSAVWEYYTKQSKDTAQCNSCSKILKSGGNTSNLFAHLRQKHSAMFTKTFGVTKAHIKTGEGSSTEKLSNPDVHMLEMNAEPELEVRGF